MYSKPFNYNWFCCCCGDGPLSLVLTPSCTTDSCFHPRCGGCEVFAICNPPSYPESTISSSSVPSDDGAALSHPSPKEERPSTRGSAYANALKDPTSFESLWEQSILPQLDLILPQLVGECYAVNVFRDPTCQDNSARQIIIIEARRAPSQAVQDRISQTVFRRLSERDRKRVRFVFYRGATERACGSCGTSEENQDHICQARRPFYLRRPPMGSSIGLAGTEQRTATLGGYILLDGALHMLTVHHLFEDHGDQSISKGVDLTQPSLEDLRGLRCEFSRLEQLAQQAGQVSTEDRAIFWDRRNMFRTPDGDEELLIGDSFRSSGFGTRISSFQSSTHDDTGTRLDPIPIEMDWAVCAVKPSRAGSNVVLNDEDLSIYANEQASTTIRPEWNVCEEICDVTPGQRVHSVGRTSGRQFGRISTCPGSIPIKHQGQWRHTRGWALSSCHGTHDSAWVEGGIGVSGDSGAWVLNEEDNKVCGMVWGRNRTFGSGPRITYFTAIEEVFEDIKKVCGVDTVELPPRPARGQASEASGAVLDFSIRRRFHDQEISMDDCRTDTPESCFNLSSSDHDDDEGDSVTGRPTSGQRSVVSPEGEYLSHSQWDTCASRDVEFGPTDAIEAGSGGFDLCANLEVDLENLDRNLDRHYGEPSSSSARGFGDGLAEVDACPECVSTLLDPKQVHILMERRGQANEDLAELHPPCVQAYIDANKHGLVSDDVVRCLRELGYMDDTLASKWYH